MPVTEQSGMPTIRCVVLPLATHFALLPGELVPALLFNENVSRPGPEAPTWLLGTVSREAFGTVPLLSYDRLCRLSNSASDFGHMALIRSLKPLGSRACYAVRLSAAPWVIEVDGTNVTRAPEWNQDLSIVASQISLDGTLGVIPDLDAIEAMVSALPTSALSADN